MLCTWYAPGVMRNRKEHETSPGLSSLLKGLDWWRFHSTEFSLVWSRQSWQRMWIRVDYCQLNIILRKTFEESLQIRPVRDKPPKVPEDHVVDSVEGSVRSPCQGAAESYWKFEAHDHVGISVNVLGPRLSSGPSVNKTKTLSIGAIPL